MSAPKSLDQRLTALRENRTSGAIDLALEALDLARDWIAADRPPEKLARALSTMHPAIATVANVGGVLREEPAAELLPRLAEVGESLVEGNRRIADNLRPLIPPTAIVVTLSDSSTVREALIALQIRSVYVLESQPGGEGAQQAKALRHGLQADSQRVRLIPDAAMGNVVPEADCALVGIDAFDRKGNILHKVGTLPLALCCRHFGKPFYAAGHSFKFADREFIGLPEPEQDLEEQFFDCTPAELITRLVTEITR